MGLDLNKIQSRLLKSTLPANTEKTKTQSELLWKPKPGTNEVRVIKYNKSPEYPFIETWFHYGKGNKMSLKTFNEADPFLEKSLQITEQANKYQNDNKDKVEQAKGKQLWVYGKNLEPQMRVFLPIIVRGEEHKGIQYWGFNHNPNSSKTTQLEIIFKIMSDPEYGDVTDYINGVDFKITYKPPMSKKDEYKDYTGEFTNNEYGETLVSAKRKESPLLTSTNPTINNILMSIFTELDKMEGDIESKKNRTIALFNELESLDKTLADNLSKILFDQPNVINEFKKPTYDELKEDLLKYITANPAPSLSEASTQINYNEQHTTPVTNVSTAGTQPIVQNANVISNETANKVQETTSKFATLFGD